MSTPRKRGRRRRRCSGLIAFGRRLLAESFDDRLPGLAAEIAFFAVLGMFPALLLAAGLLGVLGDLLGGVIGVNAQRQLLDTLDTLLTARAAPIVASVRSLFEVNASRLLSVAAVGGLITISGAVAVVIEALNLAYDVPEQRGWLHRRLLGLAMGTVTVVAAAVALAVLVVGPLFGRGAARHEWDGPGPCGRSPARTASRPRDVGSGSAGRASAGSNLAYGRVEGSICSASGFVMRCLGNASPDDEDVRELGLRP